jgi:hypothetical protein
MPHCYPRVSVSTRLFSALCREAFPRLLRMKSAIRVFLLRNREICPGVMSVHTSASVLTTLTVQRQQDSMLDHRQM